MKRYYAIVDLIEIETEIEIKQSVRHVQLEKGGGVVKKKVIGHRSSLPRYTIR